MNPTLGIQFNIDKEAIHLVKGWFKDNWLIREQDPDIFVDYVFEYIEKGEPSGQLLAVQQKGKSEIKFSKGIAKYRLATKQIKYYQSQKQLPVFLIFVDITKKDGYYVFLQEWCDNNISNLSIISKKKTHAIDISEKHKIGNPDTFIAEFKHGLEYLKRKHPGSIKDAVFHDIEQMKKIDPNFEYKLDIINSNKHYTFIPKHTVNLSVNVTGPAVQQFKDMVEFGLPIDINGQYINIKGSQHFEKKPITIFQFEKDPQKGEFNLKSDNYKFNILIPGKITTGDKGTIFRGKLEECPLKVELKIPNTAIQDNKASFKLKWDFKCWENKSLKLLPYFEPLASMSRALLDEQNVDYYFTT